MDIRWNSYRRMGPAARFAEHSRTADARLSLRGMTLVELLLVLALLVVVGSLAAPTVTDSFASVRLRRGGDTIIAAWTRARAHAIETGATYQFTYTPETSDFRVEPWTGVAVGAVTSAASQASQIETPGAKTSAAGAPSASASGATIALGGTLVAQPDDVQPADAKLSEPIKFHEGQIATRDPASAERVLTQLNGTTGSASNPILFFPDGTSSTASLVLTNGREQYVRITIRGLTGVARASSILTREELNRSNQLR